MRGLSAALHCRLFSYFISTQGDSFLCSAHFKSVLDKSFCAVCCNDKLWTDR